MKVHRVLNNTIYWMTYKIVIEEERWSFDTNVNLKSLSNCSGFQFLYKSGPSA
jgi:hypothetical protein